MLGVAAVLSFPLQVHLSPQQQAVAAVAGALAVGGVAFLVFRRPAADPAALERARRERLSQTGRITDGSLVDTTTIEGLFLDGASQVDGIGPATQMLLFRYRIAGVVYEATQDVSALSEQVRGLRIDLPIQVRYDHHNPADSIVVAEGWTGIQTRTRTNESAKHRNP